MTLDPAGMIDGPNLYTYARNNPLRFVDPWGLQGEERSSLQDFGEGALSYYQGLYDAGVFIYRRAGMAGPYEQLKAAVEEKTILGVGNLIMRNNTSRNLAFNLAKKYVVNNKARVAGRLTAGLVTAKILSPVAGPGVFVLAPTSSLGSVTGLAHRGTTTIEFFVGRVILGDTN